MSKFNNVLPKPRCWSDVTIGVCVSVCVCAGARLFSSTSQVQVCVFTLCVFVCMYIGLTDECVHTDVCACFCQCLFTCVHLWCVCVSVTWGHKGVDTVTLWGLALSGGPRKVVRMSMRVKLCVRLV